MRTIQIIIILLFVYSVCLAQTPDTAFTISGTITNYQPGKTIYMALYPTEDDFNNRNCYRKAIFEHDKLPHDTADYSFTEVGPGEYIIACYQDVNGDGKINMGLFGPTEPYRIYEPNYGLFGPKFKKCKFKVSSDIDSAHIVLK